MEVMMPCTGNEDMDCEGALAGVYFGPLICKYVHSVALCLARPDAC